MITASQIEVRFNVNPSLGKIERVGDWYSTKPVGYIKPGNQATGGGYRIVGFRDEKGKMQKVRAHHLVWMWVYGEWPKGEIDHINGNRDDNRIANLRLATVAQNRTNKIIQTNNRSGFKWVYKCCQTGKYRCEVIYQVNGIKKRFRKSGFNTPDAAYEVASNFAKSAHGKFYNPGKK